MGWQRNDEDQDSPMEVIEFLRDCFRIGFHSVSGGLPYERQLYLWLRWRRWWAGGSRAEHRVSWHWGEYQGLKFLVARVGPMKGAPSCYFFRIYPMLHSKCHTPDWVLSWHCLGARVGVQQQMWLWRQAQKKGIVLYSIGALHYSPLSQKKWVIIKRAPILPDSAPSHGP